MVVGMWDNCFHLLLDTLRYCATVLPVLFMKTSALADDVKEGLSIQDKPAMFSLLLPSLMIVVALSLFRAE